MNEKLIFFLLYYVAYLFLAKFMVVSHEKEDYTFHFIEITCADKSEALKVGRKRMLVIPSIPIRYMVALSFATLITAATRRAEALYREVHGADKQLEGLRRTRPVSIYMKSRRTRMKPWWPHPHVASTSTRSRSNALHWRIGHSIGRVDFEIATFSSTRRVLRIVIWSHQIQKVTEESEKYLVELTTFLLV